MKKKYKILLPIAALLFILGATPFLHFSKASASFNANDIIDDGVFNNTASMNPSQIDSWLNNNFPSSCISTNNGFASADPIGYNPTQGFLYGGAVSAGQVIYDAAQAYGINPQVLLTTLQKEEVLVTGSTGCATWQYTSAMGFSCTDSQHLHSYPADGSLLTPLYYKNGVPITSVPSTCVGNFDGSAGPQYAGFSEQVIWAAWLLEKGLQRSEGNVNWMVIKPNWDNSDESNCYSGPMTQGNFKRCRTDTTTTYFDGYTVIDGQSVHMDTGATATLYWYTPHFSGNQNFYSLFTSWFGSTKFSQPVGALLYYQTSTGKVYLVTTDNNTKYYVSSWAMMQNYHLDRYPLQSVDDSVLQNYTDGGNLTSLVWDNSGVYLVNDGIKYHVPSGQTCTDWALACFDNTITKQLGTTFQSSYLATGTNLANLAAYNGVFYEMSGGQRLPIADSNTLSSLGFTPNMALSFTAANVANAPLGNLLLSTATPIRFGGSSTVYYFDGSSYYRFPDSATASAWGANSPMIPPASAYDATPPTTAGSMGRWYQAADTSKYLIDQGHKVYLTPSQQQLWTSVTYQTFGTPLATSLPTINLTTYVWSSPNIYALNGNQKHYVPTYDDYVALGINSQNTTSISSDIMSLVPQGSDAFGPGKLVGVNSKVYVVSNHQLVYIPTAGVFNAFRFNWGKIFDYPSTILTDYPLNGTLTATLSYDGNFNFIEGGQRLKMSPQMAADYGLQTSQFMSIEKQVSNNLVSGQAVNRFIYNQDDGKIYYASGGALHYVSSYQAFVAYGGLRIPATLANTDFINEFLIAQPV